MRLSNCNKFDYDYCITSGYDQLCRKSVLSNISRGSGSDADWYSRWNIFFYCRFNDRCCNWSDHTKYKHCGRIYDYLYNGFSGWMCCPDSDYLSYHNYITCSYDQLCGKSLLFFSRWYSGRDANQY